MNHSTWSYKDELTETLQLFYEISLEVEPYRDDLTILDRVRHGIKYSIDNPYQDSQSLLESLKAAGEPYIKTA